MDWGKIKKIDAHIHILPQDRRLELIKYQGEECTWAKADIETYIDLMDEYNIDKAILQPTNDMYMYYSAHETNEFHAEIIKRYPNKFIALQIKSYFTRWRNEKSINNNGKGTWIFCFVGYFCFYGFFI